MSVSDDKLGAITDFTGDDGDNLLELGETWTYTKTEIVKAGQQTNIGAATGTPSQPDGTPIPDAPKPTDTDPANYFGAQPGIDIEKFVNGQDADSPTGPYLNVGAIATFTYVVKNTGNEALSSVTVTDNRLPGITFVGGDTDGDTLLDTSETWTYTASETVNAGQYTNIGTATGTPSQPDGTPIPDAPKPIDADPANYFGAQPGIDIEKFVAGQDADSPTGPYLNVGEHRHLHLRGQEHRQRGAGWRERQRRQTRRHHRLHGRHRQRRLARHQ